MDQSSEIIKSEILEMSVPIVETEEQQMMQSIEEEHLEEGIEDIVKIEETKPSIKKRVSLTIETKIEIIKRHERGESQKSLADQFNVGRTTISDILKRKNKFYNFMAMNLDKKENLKRRRTLRRNPHSVLEATLLQWYNDLRESGAYISGPMIATRAQELHKEMGYQDTFNASNGWLDRFKVRNGIKLCGIREVKAESDVNAVTPFRNELISIAKQHNLSLEQIYNADETDLFYKMLPNPESDSNEVKASVRAYRERMTVLCCANAAGTHKLPLVIIGRGKRSRTFSSTEIKNLPVHYYSQETAWMDKDIFRNWFHSHFIPSAREHLRSQGLTESALLIIDRNPSHPTEQHLRSDDKSFFTYFFPAKVRTLIQPMEQGVIREMKLQYRYDLLIELINKDLQLGEFYKQLHIKDAIRLISDGWSSISTETIQRSFSKVFPWEDDSLNQEVESLISLDLFMELITRIPECSNNNYSKQRLESWLSCDDAEPKKYCNQPSIEELKNDITIKGEHDSSTKIFDSFQDEIAPQTIEIISTSSIQDSNVYSQIEDDDYTIQEDEDMLEEEHHEILDQVQVADEINDDNIVYEESEYDVSCKHAIDALDTVVNFMKNDPKSLYRDVVSLMDIKKKLQDRLYDFNNST